MQRQQSDITSYFKVKRKEPDSPAVEDPQPAKKPKLFLTLSDSSEEEARPILPKKSKPEGEDTVEMEDLTVWKKQLESSEDEIEDWDSSDTEIIDLATFDTSVRSIPYEAPKSPASSPLKTREVFVYHSPKNTPPASPVKKPVPQKKKKSGTDDSGDEDPVQWYWRSDKGWEKYSSDINAAIEKAFQNKDARVSVDKHRYISFLDMLQLRFDDIFKTRSRGVQRKVNGKEWTGKPTWTSRTDSGRIVINDDDEATVDLEMVTPVEAQWYWRNDLGGWEKFTPSVNAVIEEAKKQARDTVQIDSERAVNIKKMTQYRLDNPTRIRKIKREEIRGEDQGRDQGRGLPGGLLRSPYFSKTVPRTGQDTPKKEGGVSIVGEWSWLGEDDTWHPYAKEISNKIEHAYVHKTNDTVAVDLERYIDLTNMLQRRYDNEDRKRYILRTIPENQMKNVEQKLTPEQLARIQRNKEAAKLRLAQAQGRKFSQIINLIDEEQKEATKPSGGSEDTVSIDEEGTIEMDKATLEELEKKEKESKGKGKEKEKEKEKKAKIPSPEDLLAWRRSQYKCKNNYVELKDIPTWKRALKTDEFLSKTPNKLPKFAGNNILNSLVSLWRGDITTLEIDAIINAAKASLLGGGGIDGAIHKAAGHGLVQECATIGGCKPGQSAITQGYRLPAKHVIHTVGPIGEKPHILRSCYLSVLKKAIKWNVKSLAFCCISTGIYGYPNEPAAKVALKTVRSFLEEDDNYKKFDRIIFCVFLKEDLKLYKRMMFENYFPPEMRTRSSSADSKSYEVGMFDRLRNYARAERGGFVGLASEWDDKKGPTNPATVFDSWVEVGKDKEFEDSNVACKQFVSQHLPNLLQGPVSFLELGCSNGWLLPWLEKENKELFDRFELYEGVDVSPKMIGSATEQLKRFPTATVFCADMTSFETTESFSCIFAMASLYYVTPMEKMAEKIQVWMKEGGLFVCGTDFRAENHNLLALPNHLCLPMDLRNKEGWEDLLRGFGLTSVSSMEIENPHQPAPTLFVWGVKA